MQFIDESIDDSDFFDEDKFDTYMPASDRELILSELGRCVGKHVVGHAQARMRRKFDTAAFDALEALSLTASLPRRRSGRVIPSSPIYIPRRSLGG